jgi:hypothetical protein
LTCGQDIFVGQIPVAEKVIRTIVVYPVFIVWEPSRRPIVRGTHSTDVGLLIGAPGTGWVLSGERVED